MSFLPIGGVDKITNTFPPPNKSNNSNQIMINYSVKTENEK